MAFRMLACDAAALLRLRCGASAVSWNSQHLIQPFSRAFATDPTEKPLTFAEDALYLDSHEWVKVEGDTGTVGISDFAQTELGDVVYVELPEAGSTVTKGETFGVVESVKAANDIYSPVSGEVVEANSDLDSTPALVNSGPFTEGWLIKVKLSDKGELGSLLKPDAYKKTCEDKHH